MEATTERPKRFEISAADEVLDDLKARLRHTRWLEYAYTAGWERGTDRTYLRELIGYWLHQFDWRAQEQRLNRYAHYRVRIDGVDVHYIQERGKGPRPLPLVVTHGWPSSFAEMLKIIPLLSDPAAHGGDPEDAFDVIIPSLPGFGYSSWPLNDRDFSVADLWKKLMVEILGYERFGAHGGDIGAGVSSRLAMRHPQHLVGVHVTSVFPPFLGDGTPPLSEAERRYVELQDRWDEEENGYGHIQSTRPNTLAHALNDSPAGLASWIIEKLRAWGDTNGDIESRFAKDELLTNVMIYWLTGSIHSSFQPYYVSRHFSRPPNAPQTISVPAGIALTREEIEKAPREWAERTYSDIRRFVELPSGGHFIALEEPELLVAELREFFRPLRTGKAQRPSRDEAYG